MRCVDMRYNTRRGQKNDVAHKHAMSSTGEKRAGRFQVAAGLCTFELKYDVSHLLMSLVTNEVRYYMEMGYRK